MALLLSGKHVCVTSQPGITKANSLKEFADQSFYYISWKEPTMMYSPPSEKLDALTPNFPLTSQREQEIAILAGNFY